MRRPSPRTPPPAGRRDRSSPTSSTGPTASTASAGTSSSPTCSCITSRARLSAASSPAVLAAPMRCAACEPRRSRFALGASHLIFFLGANAVTRNDGVLSVRAGFIGNELGAAWPGDASDVAPRRIRRRPVHPLLLRHAPRGCRMKSSFDAAIVGAGPAGLRDGDPARPRRLVGGADRAPGVSATQGLRRVRRGEQLRAPRRAWRRRRVRARAGAELRRVALLRGATP